MKKICTLFACAAAVCSCFSGSLLSEKISESIDFPDGIHALEVSGAISVTASADATEMTVTGDSLAMEKFRYSFYRGTLVLERNSFSKGGIFNSKHIDCGEICVVMPQPAGLSSVSLSGASTFTAVSPISADKVVFRVSGASVLKAEVNADVLTVKASGASVANLSGTAGEVSYEVSGASGVSSSGAYVLSENARLGVSGASNVKIGCEGLLRGEVSGASHVVCYGNPVSELRATGASKISTGR